MNILFISSKDVIAGNLAVLLKKEGHDVKLFIDNKDRKLNFDNLVKKTSDWKKEINWVGKNGLIIFDDIGYGKIQDRLRKKGFSVFGGCEIGDKLELDREFAQKILRKYGIKSLETINFNNALDCLKYIKKNKKSWVIKQGGHVFKPISYVSDFEDSRDIIDLLANYTKNAKNRIGTITLQRKIKGIEMGVGRFFNGNDWVGPIEINFEHKKLFPGDVGPLTSEMGTLAWYDDDENNILFKSTLAKLKPFLKKINFKGDFEINYIINNQGVFPLEVTPRLGSPIIYLQCEIHKSPWGDFLKAVADGKKYNLKWKQGFGVVILVAVPPFPYLPKIRKISPKGFGIFFKNIAKGDIRHIHLEGVAIKRIDRKCHHYISDDQGYVLYVTSVSKSIQAARKSAYGLIKKIHIPKMFYRNDIGLKFIREDNHLLKKWGYLNTN